MVYKEEYNKPNPSKEVKDFLNYAKPVIQDAINKLGADLSQANSKQLKSLNLEGLSIQNTITKLITPKE